MKQYGTFKNLVQTQWLELFKGPTIATIAYTGSSLVNNTFSILWACGLFFGMFGLLLLLIFIIFKILERKRKKLENTYDRYKGI